MRRDASPEDYIEHGEALPHLTLGEYYPKSWQKLEDADGSCDWLEWLPQRLATLEFLERPGVKVPRAIGEWTRVKRDD